MSRRSRWEYFRAVYARYRQAERQQKRVILDEFCANTGYNRKHAIRLLNGPAPERVPPPVRRRRAPHYSPAVVSVLARLWEAAGYPWSVRLKALVRLWRPWIQKRFRLSAGVQQQLEAISARQIDRRLRDRKQRLKHPACAGTFVSAKAKSVTGWFSANFFRKW